MLVSDLLREAELVSATDTHRGQTAADTQHFPARRNMLVKGCGESIGNPKPQATLPACEGISKDLLGINSASINVLLDRVLYAFCKGACLKKGQDLQTGELCVTMQLDSDLTCNLWRVLE